MKQCTARVKGTATVTEIMVMGKPMGTATANRATSDRFMAASMDMGKFTEDTATAQLMGTDKATDRVMDMPTDRVTATVTGDVNTYYHDVLVLNYLREIYIYIFS